MKTIINFKHIYPVLTISLVLIASTIDANAQNRRTEKKQKEKNKTEYQTAGQQGYNTSYNEKSKKDVDYSKKTYKPQYTQRVKHVEPNYFNHPKYGRVYQRFDNNPIVFSYDRGNYFYFGNQFYTYRKGIGYCVVEAPRNTYFKHLPIDFTRVYVNGNVLYRNGDLFFRMSSRGYQIVPSPFEVRFSARF